MKSGIYEITNTINGHRYVGSAVDIKGRWQNHKITLPRGTHRNGHLQNAWNKYGEDVFEFEVIEYWEPEFLISMEQWWMNMLQPEYNIAPVAGSCLGIKRTAEANANNAAAQMGNTNAIGNASTLGHVLTEEHKAKLSKAHMGHKTSTETRAKISEALKGRTLTKEHRAKLSAAKKGRSLTKEHKANISEAVSNPTAETRAKLSEAGMGNTNALGTKRSKETRAKMSVAHTGRVVTRETRKKISASKKGKGKPWSALRWARYEARKRAD